MSIEFFLCVMFVLKDTEENVGKINYGEIFWQTLNRHRDQSIQQFKVLCLFP